MFARIEAYQLLNFKFSEVGLQILALQEKGAYIMDNSNLVAPCGLVCGDCPLHLAQNSPGLKISLSDKQMHSKRIVF